jgi:hypothetical protein
MRANFATSGIEKAACVNLVDERGLLIEDRIKAVLLQNFLDQGVEEVLIEIHRKLGDHLSISQVLPYLQRHVGHSDIRSANREFTVFFEVAVNGVGRSWQWAGIN